MPGMQPRWRFPVRAEATRRNLRQDTRTLVIAQPRVMSVSIKPGATTFTVIPRTQLRAPVIY